MTRRNLLALAFFTTPLVGIAVACGFPDVNGYTFASSDSGRDDTDGGEGESEDAGEDVIIGELPDSAPVDLVLCKSCDCDSDGYWRDAASCDVDAAVDAAFIAYGDCDDSRSTYHPNQPNIFYDKVADGAAAGFDYDCSGKEETRYPQPLVCTGILNACSPASGGFSANVACGEASDFSLCGANGPLACTPIPNGTRITQLCH